MKRRVLIVDDHADSAVSLSRLLELAGHQTCVAKDAESALRLAEEFCPEVVLLDIGLPDMDGYETCRRLRTQTWGRDVLIVAMTGRGQAEDKRESLRAGFDHHVTKPADPVTLTKLVAGHR